LGAQREEVVVVLPAYLSGESATDVLLFDIFIRYSAPPLTQ
jgi:hypothetical protein